MWDSFGCLYTAYRVDIKCFVTPNIENMITAKNLLQKYKGAIIFLIVLFVVTVVLVLLYLMLKRGFCCFCCQKKSDEEEGLYTDPEFDEEEEDAGDKPVMTNGNLHPSDVTTEEEEDPYQENTVPDVLVTEAEFVPAPHPPSKKKQLSSMLKKIKRVRGGKVRFRPDSEQVSMLSSEGTISNSDYGSMGYDGGLAPPLQRTSSMESFMSAMSSATTNNVDEFGVNELSPSRVQIFLQYDPKLWTLIVGVKQADCLISTSGASMYWQAHITLLPFKKHRFKTKYKSSSTPIFNQNYEVENIAQQALSQLSVRYRIYGRSGRGGRKKLAGETEVELSYITQMEEMIIKDWRVLRRKGGPNVRQESEV